MHVIVCPTNNTFLYGYHVFVCPLVYSWVFVTNFNPLKQGNGSLPPQFYCDVIGV